MEMYGQFLHGNAGLSTEVSEMMVTALGEPAVVQFDGTCCHQYALAHTSLTSLLSKAHALI